MEGTNMGKNNIPATENSEKKMTKYDRKMLARKEAEIREKRQRRMTRITAYCESRNDSFSYAVLADQAAYDAF